MMAHVKLMPTHTSFTGPSPATGLTGWALVTVTG
jgi:hypothetical protein